MSDSGIGLWSVRGVPEDVRKLAAEAAKAQAIPIGQWVSHAIRQTAASDRGGLAGEVVSDRPSDGGSLEVVSALFAGLGQVAGVKGCGGTAARARAVLDQHLARLALEPLPSRRAPPKQITASSD